MIDLNKVPQIFIEAWGVYEALRKMGFADDDVSYIYGPVETPGGERLVALQVRLETQGLRFVCIVGPLEESLEKSSEIMMAFAAAIADGTIDDASLRRLWQSTRIGSSTGAFSSLGSSIVAKGFFLPALVGKNGLN